MPKVYVVQQHIRRDRESGVLTPHDYKSAETFGKIVVLVPTRDIVNADWGGDVEKMLASKFEDFTTDDYLLPSGDPILCCQAILAAANVLPEKSKIKMLKWERKNNTYTEVLITIPF